MLTIELSKNPEIKRIILAADPSYRKAKAYLRVYHTANLSGTYWDGGSRSTYTAVRLLDCFNIGAPQYDPPQYGGPRVSPTVEIPDGIAIVETGIFCGKKATASVTINPNNAAKLLTSETL